MKTDAFQFNARALHCNGTEKHKINGLKIIHNTFACNRIDVDLKTDVAHFMIIFRKFDSRHMARKQESSTAFPILRAEYVGKKCANAQHSNA